MLLSNNFLTILYLLLICVSNRVEAKEFGYTEQEKLIIPKFHMLVENDVIAKYMLHDSYLVRWIRSTNYDLEKAREKFVKHVQWKKELNDSDYLRDEIYLNRLLPYKFIQAKDGRPAFFGHFGEWNIRKVELTSKQRNPITRHIMKIMEELSLKIIESSYQGNPNVTNGIEVFDVSGYNLRTQACAICVSDILNGAVTWEAQYPRLLGDILLINTPRIFENLLNLLKTAFGDYYSKIFQVYGLNKAEWEGPLISLVGRDPFLKDNTSYNIRSTGSIDS